MFGLLAVFGIALGWLAVQLKWIRDRHSALEHISNCVVVWGDGRTKTLQCFVRGDYRVPSTYSAYIDEPALPPWSLGLFGERGISVIALGMHDDTLNARAEELRRLFPEATVEVLDDDSKLER